MSTRDSIIDAAMAIVRDEGTARLTLDAAAKRAGVSKGGVLYHFKTKDDLIRGMVEKMITQCDTLYERLYAEESEGPYRWARTVVRMAFHPEGPANDPVGGAMLTAVSLNPELVAPLQAKYDEWLARIASDSPNPALASLVCMAMDGYYFERMMHLNLSDEHGWENIKQTALELLK